MIMVTVLLIMDTITNELHSRAFAGSRLMRYALLGAANGPDRDRVLTKMPHYTHYTPATCQT